MGVYAGPEITSDGLVLALDAGNSKGFDDDENLISHSSMSGWTVGVLGSGGALPTGWGLDQLQPGSTIQIIGGGVEDGLNYVDIRFFATSVSTSNRTLIRPGNSVTTDGSTYYLTTYSKLVSGSTNNLTHINFHTGALSLTNVLTRNIGASAVLSGTFFPRYDIGYNGTGVAYDITIRFAAPQLERGSSASPYYPTTGTAKNRGSTLIDMTGRGNSGTLTNGPTYSSANGGSLVFDGTNDYILGTINGSIFTGSFTQSAWIYKLNNNQIWQGVFTNSSPATNNTYLMTFGNGSVAAPYNSVGANQVGISDSGIFLDIGTHTNRWLYIVMTKTGSTLNIYCYKDGTLLQTSGTITWNGGNFATTNNYEIGRHWAGGSIVPLQGNVSQVSIYNRALSAAEIQQNFNALRGRFGI